LVSYAYEGFKQTKISIGINHSAGKNKQFKPNFNFLLFSASWGPTDDGKTVDGPRELTLKAIVNGVNKVSWSVSKRFCSVIKTQIKMSLRFENCNRPSF